MDTQCKTTTVISCDAPIGKGGLGQHLAMRVAEVRATGSQCGYYASRAEAGDRDGHTVDNGFAVLVQKYTPVRFDRGLKSLVELDLFDRKVAGHLPSADTFVGFVGQALHSIRRARKLRYKNIELEVCNSHVRNVAERHSQAFRRWGMEKSWLNELQIRKTEREYSEADTLIYTSDYTRQTLLDRGIDANRLVKKIITVHPRFVPAESKPDDGVFRVVYVGSVTVAKGIPVLLEAFSKLKGNAQLTIVGGWATSEMKTFVKSHLNRDPRISMAAGDPLNIVQDADVLVHPTYEDGFAYSAAEALACHTPVIVTEDTGMKELVLEGKNGYIVPTGDVDAIYERLSHMRDYGVSHLQQHDFAGMKQ